MSSSILLSVAIGTLDRIFSATALVLFAPLSIPISILIRLESPGPIFFKQTRIGKGLKEFQMYKFRSMDADAESRGPHFTNKGDSRVTRVGSFLRKFSVDEFPQLLNVLRGDMSLVGPRPLVPGQVGEYEERTLLLRSSVLPGITGLAQVRNRHEGTFDERLASDMEFVQGRSLIFYFKILVATSVALGAKRSY